MSIAVMILGPSGSGKSFSLANLNPDEVTLIQPIKKPLPFKSGEWKLRTPEDKSGAIYRTDDAAKIETAIRRTDRDIIIVDDYQAVLTNELMRRSTENGFQKFADIGRGAWNIFTAAGDLEEHKRVYILAHTQTDDFGNIRMKTVGKMVDEKVVPEGYFTIVLRAEMINGQHVFATQSNGQDCCKSPPGMFDGMHIPNDLAAVDAAICEFYGLTQPA
ncbi:ATP-binding protein [Bordetella genomosp. 7]|uniref:ATP-binding protein n=1 Tax=Bordetella genomosp. 7 TaxID=1416805 RepID=A0A261QYW0_9BORD|nr:ATP-binding protein [Bordetella genomosp. 7]OZI17959.1 ATP-binding protein [Bordetella genomosp. 7]